MQNFLYLCQNHVQEMRPCMGEAWWIRMLFYWPRVNKYCQHFPRVHWKQNKQTKITYLLLQNYIVCEIICLPINLLRSISECIYNLIKIFLELYVLLFFLMQLQFHLSFSNLEVLKIIDQKVEKNIYECKFDCASRIVFVPVFFSSKLFMLLRKLQQHCRRIIARKLWNSITK